MEHEHTKGLYGQITHTELASHDPEAARSCGPSKPSAGSSSRPSQPLLAITTSTSATPETDPVSAGRFQSTSQRG